jgi:hypothetical protein
MGSGLFFPLLYIPDIPPIAQFINIQTVSLYKTILSNVSGLVVCVATDVWLCCHHITALIFGVLHNIDNNNGVPIHSALCGERHMEVVC